MIVFLLPSLFAYTPVSSEVESNNTMGTADVIKLDDGKSATLNTLADVDWFRFRPMTSGEYRFDISDMPKDMDYDMMLYDSNNNALKSSTRVNTAYETIIVNLTNNQDYYVRVYSYKGFSKIDQYMMTVTNDKCALYGWLYPFINQTPPKKITSKYGDRTGQYAGKHLGIDIGDSFHQPIYSATPGTVFEIGTDLSTTMGHFVAVKVPTSMAPTSNTIVTYMHMRSPTKLKKGDTLTAEYTNLGHVGGSGLGSTTAYGAHLHFQVSTNGSIAAQTYYDTLNPVRFFPNTNFTGEVDYDEIPYSLSSDDPTQMPLAYTMVSSSLIDVVGENEFNEWFNMATIETRNLPGFLNYFEISDEQCIQILKNAGVGDYYAVEEVFEYRDLYEQK